MTAAGRSEMHEFTDEAGYLDHLRRAVPLPEGFRAASTALSFVPAERPTLEPYRMDISALVTEPPTESFAAVFTRNAIPGAPVIIGRRRLVEPATRGVLVNNRISNVCAPGGEEDAEQLAASFASRIDAKPTELFPVSTGIIGWKLPVSEMERELPILADRLSADHALEFAAGIMTTDSFVKMRRASVGEGSVVGIAKGAGMIEPNMATMLAFVVTDLDVSPELCRAVLPEAVETSFNSISIDSDQSTSDMALLLSSRRRPRPDDREFSLAVAAVCELLAEDIVRNGEGAGHVIRVDVDGCRNAGEAKTLGKAVINSPLVKTAIYGNDPNVGRIVSAIGDCAGTHGIALDHGALRVEIGTVPVFEGGVFLLDREKEIHLSSYLKRAAMNPRLRGFPQHMRCVDLHISCGAGNGFARVSGSDLSDEYVHENADYRS